MTAHATPGHPIVRGPFSFAYNMAGLSNGVAFYTPTVGDLLVGFSLARFTEWDGAAAKFDFGPFVNSTTGLYDLTGVNVGGFNLLFASGLYYDTLRTTSAGIGEFGYLLPIVTDDPWKIVVSQDGTKGGPAVVDATQGAAKFYIVTATPTPF